MARFSLDQIGKWKKGRCRPVRLGLVMAFFQPTISFAVLAFVLAACSSPRAFTPGSEEQLEYDADVIQEHSERLAAYQDWMDDASAELADQREELEDLIDELNGLDPTTILETEYQHQLRQDMMSFSMQFLHLQNAMQQNSSAFDTLQNILEQKHGTTKDAIKNVR
jgi:hypothetical protein